MSISKQEILQIVEIFRHDRWSDWKNIGCLKVQWSWAAKQLENSFETRNDERLALLKDIQQLSDPILQDAGSSLIPTASLQYVQLPEKQNKRDKEETHGRFCEQRNW